MVKKLAIAAVVLVGLGVAFLVGRGVGSGSGALAAVTNPAAPPAGSAEESTKFERFASRKGRLVIKDVYSAGTIRGKYGDAEVNAVMLTSAADNERVYAVTFSKEASSSYASSSSAALDFDEAVALSVALARMTTMAGEMGKARREYTEVEFRSVSGLVAGFYQSGVEQASYFQLEKFGSDATVFGDVAQMTSAKAVVDVAIAKLRELGAK
jgi:hypothetical protein